MGLLRLKRICSEITYPGLVLEAGYDGWKSPPHDEPNLFLRWCAPDGTCNRTGQPLPWKGRKWRLSKHMTDGEVVWTAFAALLQCLEHEARELFTFQGAPVADSHIDIHKLVQLHQSNNATQERIHHG